MKKILMYFCIIIAYSNFVKAIENEENVIIASPCIENKDYNTLTLLTEDSFINKKIIDNLILLKKVKTQKRIIYCIIASWIISFVIAGVVVYFEFIR